jgi:hypothetical protein
MKRIEIGLGIALLATMTGCVGYVDGGYYGGPVYGGPVVVVPAPAVYFWGGDYDRGRDVHVYSHRGVESRAVAHPGGGGQVSRSAPARPTPSPSPRSGGGGRGGRQ